MLSNDFFKESREGIITMESVDEADVETFVSYAYTGQILLTDSNALKLLELANYLAEDGIKAACIKFLEKHLKVEEACRACKLASTFDLSLLKNTAKAKIIKNFDVCSKSSDYLDFDLDIFMDILTNVKAYPINWQHVFFKGIMRWIMHNTKDRKIHMINLLSCINISALTADCLLSYLSENVEACNDEYDIVKDVMFYHELCKNQEKEQKEVLMILGWKHSKSSFQFYNFLEEKWSSIHGFSDSDDDYFCDQCAVCNDNLFSIAHGSRVNHLQVFNLATQRNERLHSSSSILQFTAVCACSRYVYLCGGTTESNHVSDQVLRYDPQNNLIEKLPQMANKKSHAAAVFYQGCIYVLGGSGIGNLVEKYDSDTKCWTACASMCEPRYGLEVVVLDGKLYACGGFTETAIASNSMEVYDPLTNRWQLIAKMNKCRNKFCLVAHEGKLLAVGGLSYVRGVKEKIIEVYDPNKDKWYIDPKMNTGFQLDYKLGGLVSSSCISNKKLDLSSH